MRKIKVAGGKFYSKMVCRRVLKAELSVAKQEECEAILSLRVCQQKNGCICICSFVFINSKGCEISEDAVDYLHNV